MLKSFATAAFACLAAPLCAQDATIIVLDASGSMWGQIDGQNKIVIARDVVRDVLQRSDAERSIGLMAYGHNRRGDCSDIEMLVPPGAGQAATVSGAVDAITPRGKTPLSEAVRQAATALRHSEQRATVVLVTDGVETCRADPCDLARELEQTGVDFTTHVVGFGLGREQGAGVSCLATETGGQYFEASNRAELATALFQTMATAAPEPQVEPEPAKVAPKHNLHINVQITADDPPLEPGQIHRLDLRLIRQSDGKETRLGGNPAQSRSIEPGDYRLWAKYEGGQAEMPVEVREFDVAHATLALGAGLVDIQATLASQEFEVSSGKISWQVKDLATNKRLDLFAPRYNGVLGAGRYHIMPVLDRNPKMSDQKLEVEINAGELHAAEVVFPHGRLMVQPQSEDGSPLSHGALRIGLWGIKPDGSADRVLAYKAGAKDPIYALPGKYILALEDWGPGKPAKRELRQVIELSPGQALDIRAVMPSDPELPIQLMQK
ncbi:VWA domain-containing protein [Pseudophaeobacter sp.]|uniref:vWA domain-containing protein n=1 Tax=Pseudophaeobacter sp. TaxID=1971739 RepID=UPI00329A1C62